MRQFFDKELVKSDELAELFGKLPVNAVTAGRGQLLFGSSNGFVSAVDRDLVRCRFAASAQSRIGAHNVARVASFSFYFCTVWRFAQALLNRLAVRSGRP